MTSPEPMTTTELLELAALDALGLLDEYESAFYSRSFHHAPVTVQDEIKRIQAEVTSDKSLLPDEEPDSSLRQRVLEVMAKAVEREASELAPLATIGRRPGHGPGETGGRSDFGASGQFWRAAAFVMAGVVMVMAYFWSEAHRESNHIADLALSNITDDELAEIVGPTFVQFVTDPGQQKFVTTLRDKNGKAWANVFVKVKKQELFLLHGGLPKTKDNVYVLHLRRRDGDGSVEELGKFDSTGSIIGGVRLPLDKLKLSSAVLAMATWEITDLAGTILLSSP